MSARGSAKRYAKALFDVALKEADPEVVGRDLASFAGLVAGHAELSQVLTNPAVPAPRKRALAEELSGRTGLIEPVRKLLGLLADRDRFVLLSLIDEKYRERLLEHLQVVNAEVTTAIPVADTARRAIEGGLRDLTGRIVALTLRTDPDILGGVVAQIGSTVYDGSLKRQLERMREKLAGSA